MSKQFNEDGTYNKTDWKAGDKITATKLNKIEDAIEAVNNNDISRHEEADARLDALEAGVVANKQEIEAKVDALEDAVVSNKDAADLDIYRIDQHMTLLDKKIDDGVAEVYGVAETMDGKIAEADASMKAYKNEISEKLEHIENINVLSEVGNNYSEKLQNALNNFEGQSGRIFLPHGVVELHEINLPSNKQFTFIGYGMNKYSVNATRIIPKNENTRYLFGALNPGVNYNHFENITFDGLDSCQFGLHGDYFMGTHIKRCYFTGFNEVACELKQGLSHIEGCYFRNNEGVGLIVHSDSYITNNEFSKGSTSLIVESGGNRIIGNLINSSLSYGLHLKPTLNVSYSESTVPLSQNNLISGNYFGGNGDYCIFIEGDNRKNVHSNLITSNYFEMTYSGVVEGAIKGTYLTNCQINDNIIIGNLNNTLESILLENSENCTISNTSASRVANNVIKLLNTHDCIINTVNIRDCNGYGIYLDNSTRNIVSNIKTIDLRSEKLLKCFYNNASNNMFTNIDYNGLSIDDYASSYKELKNGSYKIYSSINVENGTHTLPSIKLANGFGVYGIGTTGFGCVKDGVEYFKLNNLDFTVSKGNLEVGTTGKSIVIKSPNNTRYKIEVTNDGVLYATKQ